MEELVMAIATLMGSSVAIHFAAESFEGASDYLGRNFPPGVKGATLNAVASSLPEVFTTLFLLFYLQDTSGFASGLATCAGSAMFNMTVIPGLCLLFTASAVRKQGAKITPSKRLIIRDVIFFLAAEALLIWVVNLPAISAPVALCLVAGYSFYAFALIRQFRSPGREARNTQPEEALPPEDLAEPSSPQRLWAWITLDARNVLFPGKAWTRSSAILVLLIATALMGIACDFLARSVLGIAGALEISPFFAAVILAAAGTSIPDTLLSIKDAKKGNYEDALSNAFGSNIFNIFVALGLPVLLFTVLEGHPLPLVDGSPESAVEMERVKDLCFSLLGASLVTAAVLVLPRELSRRHGWMLLGLYALWALWTVLPLTVS